MLSLVSTGRAAVALAALLAVGCGSSNGGPGAGTTGNAAQTTSTAERSPGAAPEVNVTLVRLRNNGEAEPAKRVRARPGDSIQIRVAVANAAEAEGAEVKLIVDRGPEGMLRAAASRPDGSGRSVAVVSAPGKARLRAENFRYTCFVPPTPTFCPVAEAEQTASRYEITFPVPAGEDVPIRFVADLVRPSG